MDQFKDAVCNVLNGINNTYDRKNFKGRPKFALFCSYCSSHGHTKGRCFKRPQREQQSKPRERSFYGQMRNNQNLPNRQITSNNVNGRQLPSTSPVYCNHRSRTPNRNSRYPSKQSNLTYKIIMVDTRTDHTVIIDHTVTINLIVIIDHKADITTITKTDHRVIAETILAETIQITGVVVTATTEIPTVQIQIIVITKDIIHDHHTNIHDHRINPDHHIIEIETLIAITEVDTTATIEIEDPITKITDKIVITETEIIINHTIDKTGIE